MLKQYSSIDCRTNGAYLDKAGGLVRIINEITDTCLQNLIK